MAADLRPDDRNANKGSTRGGGMIEESLQRLGCGRSVVADKNGKLIAGNKTTEAFIANGNQDVLVVRTDGSQLVVVQRTDLDLDVDEDARLLAYADNRTSEVSHEWDTAVLFNDSKDERLDLSWLFRGDELDEIFNAGNEADSGDDDDSKSDHTLTLVFGTKDEAQRARATLEAYGYVIR